MAIQRATATYPITLASTRSTTTHTGSFYMSREDNGEYIVLYACDMHIP